MITGVLTLVVTRKVAPFLTLRVLDCITSNVPTVANTFLQHTLSVIESDMLPKSSNGVSLDLPIAVVAAALNVTHFDF